MLSIFCNIQRYGFKAGHCDLYFLLSFSDTDIVVDKNLLFIDDMSFAFVSEDNNYQVTPAYVLVSFAKGTW